MEKYKIYEDGEHHLGLISNDGKHKTPAVYDEIQIREDGIWYCRAYINWDYFYPASGTFSVKSRKGTKEWKPRKGCCKVYRGKRRQYK